MNRIISTAIGCLLAVSGVTEAQVYPNKPVRMLVAVPPGGPADTLARLVGPRLNRDFPLAPISNGSH